jgi:hypothetical protein
MRVKVMVESGGKGVFFDDSLYRASGQSTTGPIHPQGGIRLSAGEFWSDVFEIVVDPLACGFAEEGDSRF